MTKAKPPVMYLEYCDKRSSGFVKKGTENTPFHEELNCPNIAWIPNTGFKAVKEVHKDDAGNDVITTVFREIRWIKTCDSIDLDEQNRRNIRPNKMEDKIPFEKGFATVVRDGGTISLYDFLKEAFYNKSNPLRPSSAEAIYQVMELDKKAEEFNEDEIEKADAISLVGQLRQKTGDKETPYKYDEGRIDLICELCQVHADSPALKLHALMTLAKTRSRWFLNLVSKFEQTIITEVTHALKLNVIRFDGNTAVYVEGDKVLKALGAGNLGHDKKVSILGQYLGSKEGANDLTELRAHIEVAKENALK